MRVLCSQRCTDIMQLNCHFNFVFFSFEKSAIYPALNLKSAVFDNKFPTLTAASFFVKEESSPYSFGTEVNRFSGNLVVTGLSPCFSQNLFRAILNPDENKGPFNFLGVGRLFFENILNAIKGPTFKFSALRVFSK